MFIICLYMFRALCAHHQEVRIVLYSIWYHHTCRWPSGALDSHLQVWWYQMLYNTILTSWWWAHSARNMQRHNWINELLNTTIWWLDICCLLHRYQLHVLALMAFFRLIDWQQTCKQLYFGMHLVYGAGGLGLDGGTRSCVWCWVGRVMWVHGYYCAGLRKHKIKIQVDRLTTNL